MFTHPNLTNTAASAFFYIFTVQLFFTLLLCQGHINIELLILKL